MIFDQPRSSNSTWRATPLELSIPSAVPQPDISKSPSPPPFFWSSALAFVFFFACSTHSPYASGPSFNLSPITPFNTSPANPTKLCLRRAFSNCHSFLFCSSLINNSTSPISLALTLKSFTIANKLNRISVAGYLSILLCKTGITFSGNSSTVDAPWDIGAGWRPSNS